MSPEDENLTPAEKFAALVEAEAAVKTTKGKRPSNAPATLHDVNQTVKPVERKLRLNGWLTAVGGTIVLIGSVAGGILATQTIAKEKATEVVTDVRHDTEANKERLDFFKDEFKRHLADENETHMQTSRALERTNRRLDKSDEKQELMLDALKVPLSKRPKREVEEP